MKLQWHAFFFFGRTLQGQFTENNRYFRVLFLVGFVWQMRSFFLFFLLAQSPDIFISASFLALHHNNVWLFLWGSLIDHCVCFQTAGLVKSLMDHSVRLLGWSKFDGSFCQTAGLVRV